MTRERSILGSLLVLTFAIRAIYPGQPIVENYVGRQIPTAMVARNLERGSGFLHPQLDTGPFPNLFLVEPPIYAQVVVALRPILGFDLESTGRLVSAAATTLAAWGLFGLARRREGSFVALLAVITFAIFPVMIRYGRAFQPDALMVGCVLAGLRGWDEFEAGGNWRWAIFGGFVLAIGLALKITTAWALIPFLAIVHRWPTSRKMGVSAALLAPAMAWYLLIWDQVARPGSGSSASLDNAHLWAQSLSVGNWLRVSTFHSIGRGLLIQSFTPAGFVLVCWGLVGAGKLDRLWLGWGVGCALSILGLASKWHHAYYWMVVAPLAAVGMARGLVRLGLTVPFGRPLVAVVGSGFLTLCVAQSITTWVTPTGWQTMQEAADAIDALTSEEQLVIAPEAVLHYANRRGFRLEFDPAACRRAAGEWGYPLPNSENPLALIDLYRGVHQLRSNRLRLAAQANHLHFSTTDHILVADVGLDSEDAGRRTWRAAIRKRPHTQTLIDRPDLMLAELY